MYFKWGDKKNYRIFARNTFEMRLSGRPRKRWVDNNEVGLIIYTRLRTVNSLKGI
jgi:hypothetical protein